MHFNGIRKWAIIYECCVPPRPHTTDCNVDLQFRLLKLNQKFVYKFWMLYLGILAHNWSNGCQPKEQFRNTTKIRILVSPLSSFCLFWCTLFMVKHHFATIDDFWCIKIFYSDSKLKILPYSHSKCLRNIRFLKFFSLKISTKS